MSYEYVLTEVSRIAPGFAPRWEAFKVEWRDEEFLPLYLAMGDLAQYLVESYATGATAEFPAVFSSMERYLQANDENLENLIVVGLFEVVQNLGSQRPFGCAVFESWLGPTTAQKWKEIDRYMDEIETWVAEQNEAKRRSVDVLAELESITDPVLRAFVARDRRIRR